ncbi:MAG TPA: twin-arginine translocation signal domain-containing protein, partial [Actinomycetota bacterium]|nr:twin-arginine translocation signal domain-containing protein [Actinomycetota bacterium]
MSHRAALSYRAANPDPEASEIDRRTFLKAAGGSAAAALLAACENETTPSPTPPPPDRVVEADFAGTHRGWGPDWVNVRYEGPWSVEEGRGVIEVEPAVEKALQEGKEVAEYMARPVISRLVDADEVEVAATVELDGPVEAGVVARVSYEEGYALLVRDGEARLYRYDVVDRKLLAKESLDTAGPVELKLVVRGADITATAGSVRLTATDDDPLERGFAGVVVNPASTSEGGRALFDEVAIVAAPG